MLRIGLITSLFLGICYSSLAQNGTEIYLLDFSTKGGQIQLSNPRNISEKIGYDNQPFFHPSRPLLYYTSAMPDGQSDIWVYDLGKGTRSQLTQTPDLEYSPTVVPGGEYLSCIVQRKANGDQDLVKYSLVNPEKSELILSSQRTGKIGYQAWLNPNQMVAFVLGEPATLHYFDFRTGQDTIVAPQIGRSLHRIPKRHGFSFVQKIGDRWMIRSFEPTRGATNDIAESDAQSEHFNAWLPNGQGLLESRSNQLWHYDLKRATWQQVSLPESLPTKKITRIAVSRKQIALVIDE
jgi:dipeptidyl aminopeptidase/acylaminoacyl peptidase